MLDLDHMRKRLPEQFAQMSDEQLEVYLSDLYVFANLAVDWVIKKKKAVPSEGEKPSERS